MTLSAQKSSSNPVVVAYLESSTHLYEVCEWEKSGSSIGVVKWAEAKKQMTHKCDPITPDCEKKESKTRIKSYFCIIHALFSLYW